MVPPRIDIVNKDLIEAGNSIDAMKDVDGTRELVIKSQQAKNEQVMVCVSDTGVGLPQQQADEIYNAFFTTKQHGIGMGIVHQPFYR